MTLYRYVVALDRGFAPNPFWGYCTLATCKPQIRLHAEPGDWVAGMGSSRKVGQGKLVFALRVSEKLYFEQYNADPRFANKKPPLNGPPIQLSGDNIYYKSPDRRWKRRRSLFYRHAKMGRDLKGKYVLIAKEFYYFGADAQKIPSRYIDLIPHGRGHRNRSDPNLVDRFVGWLQTISRPGVHGSPWEWPGRRQNA